jgi:hypothetical protein
MSTTTPTPATRTAAEALAHQAAQARAKRIAAKEARIFSAMEATVEAVNAQVAKANGMKPLCLTYTAHHEQWSSYWQSAPIDGITVENHNGSFRRLYKLNKAGTLTLTSLTKALGEQYA